MTDQMQLAPARPVRLPAATACRLYLIRHGTATTNTGNRYRGRRDVPLDGQGYREAVDLAWMLSPVGLTAVYAGPLRRTITAAQIIADACDVPDLRILHGLHNLDYGTWEGMTAQEAALYHPEAFELYRTSPRRATCSGGERLSDAQARMVDAVQLIGSRHGGEAVAAVTHAVMIRLLVAYLNGTDDAGWRTAVSGGPCTEFAIDHGVVTLAGTAADDNGGKRG